MSKHDPLRVFIGYDPRQPIAYNVLQHSIVRHSSRPVAITPLILSQLPIKRRGLTEFTFSRFLVPYLCGFRGQAVFMDADMVVTGDIAELLAGQNANTSAVSVMQDQAPFEWASMMHFNAGACLRLKPEFIDDEKNALFDLAWAPYVGKLAPEWNHCVGYQEPKEAKLYHFTQGIPHWYECMGLPEDAVWHEERKALTHSVPWRDLMSGSVHAEPVMKRLVKRCMGQSKRATT